MIAAVDTLTLAVTQPPIDARSGRADAKGTTVPTFRDFVLAGKAIFTVSNPTGQHFTYRVGAKEGRRDGDTVFFVSLLTGPVNTSDYTYLGILDPATGTVRRTAKSRIGADATGAKVIAWALSIVWQGRTLPTGYQIQHAGKCGRCARTLTDPLSIALGIGPECRNQMGF